MTFLNQKIASRQTRKWFIVLSQALLIFAGFEALSFLTGIYQVPAFLNVAVFLYLYLALKMAIIFDLKLKVPRSWERSAYYYHHVKHRFLKWLRIIWRALRLRFHYIFRWDHWLHFQHYLILPGVLYWAVVVLIFLNPFATFTKQLFVIAGTLFMTIVIWYLKTIFINYSAASRQLRMLMLTITVITAFLINAAALGLVWYLGLSAFYFIAVIGSLSFLLMYQSLFRSHLVNFSNLKFVLLGTLIQMISASIVFEVWTVNFYSAGLLLAGLLHFHWGLSLLHLEKRLTQRLVLEYLVIFLVVLIFVLTTTNFQARIG